MRGRGSTASISDENAALRPSDVLAKENGMGQQALFTGLVYDEDENLVETAVVGEETFYVVDDNGFLRHIEAEEVDRQVLQVFVEQLHENKDMAIEQALRMMGQDDLLTKAALDAQMRNVSVDQILQQGIPEQAREMMGMVGFRVVINVHGELVRFDQPAVPGSLE